MKYETPKLNVIEFDNVDVIQTSGEGYGPGGENELPTVPFNSPTNIEEQY